MRSTMLNDEAPDADAINYRIDNIEHHLDEINDQLAAFRADLRGTRS